MKDKMLKSIYRYDAIEDSYHVVINLDTYRDAYSEWDYSPITNRDLDEDLIEYLVDCSNEIGLKRKMFVDFYIPKNIVDYKRERKSVNGFRHYFAYQIRKANSDKLRKLKNTLILLLIGIIFLTIAIIGEGKIDNYLLSKIVSEGLFIGAWVAIWEIFSTVFFDIKNMNDDIKHFKRLMDVDINYKEKD